MKVLTLILTFLIPAAAFGRVGETKEECIQRYGPPIAKGTPDSLTFQKKGKKDLVKITAYFTFEQCYCMTYEETVAGNGGEIAQPYPWLLLYAPLNEWKEPRGSRFGKPGEFIQKWETLNHEAEYMHIPNGRNKLTIKTRNLIFEPPSGF